MAVYGYARVSTEHQNIERQIRNIKGKYPEAEMHCEEFTGTSIDRPVFKKMLKKLKKGDVVVFDSVSRMSRTAEDGLGLYVDLMEKGVKLIFLKEPHINTQTFQDAMDRIVLPEIATGDRATDSLVGSIVVAVNVFMRELLKKQIEQAFKQAEKEVLDLRQRTKEGIETARLAGKQIGRPTGKGKTFMTKKEKSLLPLIKKMSKSFDGSLSDVECIEILKISRNTFYKYKKEVYKKEVYKKEIRKIKSPLY